jgi:hypothetical protein
MQKRAVEFSWVLQIVFGMTTPWIAFSPESVHER